MEAVRQTPSNGSRANDMMSPRRLDAIRANGNKIVGNKQLNELDAASNYKRALENRASPSHAQRAKQMADMVDPKEFDQMDAECQMNSNLHLVPCRWERSGWRYVQADPADIRFFKNPNRVNNFGVGAERKRFHSTNMRQTFFKSANKSAFGPERDTRFENTTYGRTFVNQRGQSPEAQPWNQTPKKQSKGNDELIQWAGEQHKRNTFKKTKDYIGDWTNVLFRA